MYVVNLVNLWVSCLEHHQEQKFSFICLINDETVTSDFHLDGNYPKPNIPSFGHP